jgi:hypothetical protein
MFPGAALAHAPASALLDSVAQLSPAQTIENATGLLIDVFVEGAWQRSGVRWNTEAERDAITEKFTNRLTELFVGDPEFAEWICSLDDPRPALCALILRWTREPEAGVTFDEPVCAHCHLAGICPNTGFSHKEASEGHTYKVIVPYRRSQPGGGMKEGAVVYPCSQERLYDFGQAKKLVEVFALRRHRDPKLAVWAIGRTQKFDAGCLKYGIANPDRE